MLGRVVQDFLPVRCIRAKINSTTVCTYLLTLAMKPLECEEVYHYLGTTPMLIIREIFWQYGGSEKNRLRRKSEGVEMSLLRLHIRTDINIDYFTHRLARVCFGLDNSGNIQLINNKTIKIYNNKKYTHLKII